jgi:hypothetical protein
MIRIALSALIALAVLAPVASAADEVKPPRQNEQAAPTCRMPAAEVDPKAPPAPRLSKAELEALRKLPLCPADEPGETCLMVDRAVYEKQMWTRSNNGAAPPAWVQNYDECMRRQPGDQSGADGSYDGGRDRSLHTT